MSDFLFILYIFMNDFFNKICIFHSVILAVVLNSARILGSGKRRFLPPAG